MKAFGSSEGQKQCFELLQILAVIEKTVAFNLKYSAKTLVYVFLTYIFQIAEECLQKSAKSECG